MKFRKTRFFLFSLITITSFLSACSNKIEGVETPISEPEPETVDIQEKEDPCLTLIPDLDIPTESAPQSDIDSIQIAWFYKPPDDETIMEDIVDHFDFYILTKNDEDERDYMKSLGADESFYQYFRFEAIFQPEQCLDSPRNNQVAYLPGDFCNIEEQHPDWFLKDTSGDYIQTSSEAYIHMDPGNSGWQTFSLNRMREIQEKSGWDGVFLDNVDASLNRTRRDNIQQARYAGDSAFQEAVTNFLKMLYHSYFKPSGRPLFANILFLKDPAIWFQYLQFLDGAMIEDFAADWDYGFLSVEDWETHLCIAEKTQQLGKEIILVTQGDQNDLQRQAFAFGSYLLVQQGQASFRYTNDENYRNVWMYDNYKMDIGQPLGPRYQEDGIWKREFTGGTVEVDPSAHLAQFHLK
ncbi:MAG: hypothetical protein JEZ06_02035 [Anaerolineaceae bacterium]|nr:hypothetical protein [Anaerolineaceae bacterium]